MRPGCLLSKESEIVSSFGNCAKVKTIEVLRFLCHSYKNLTHFHQSLFDTGGSVGRVLEFISRVAGLRLTGSDFLLFAYQYCSTQGDGEAS